MYAQKTAILLSAQFHQNNKQWSTLRVLKSIESMTLFILVLHVLLSLINCFIILFREMVALI